jgi:sugar phosphate isomerase/epimerase
VREIEKLMEEASILGATHCQFSQVLHGRLSHEKAVRLFHDVLRQLSNTAKNLGLLSCSEEYCGLSGDEIYLAVKDTPNIALLNDIGNWLILGEDPIAATKKFITITNLIHVKDYIFEDGIWRSVPFGEGIIDVKQALNIIADTPGEKIIYAPFETDLDSGDEDEAMDKCFRYFVEWENSRK